MGSPEPGGGGGGVVTVMVLVPVRPSLVAVIVAVPPAIPRTRPVEETEATLGLPDDHVSTRPVSTLFDASRSVAESCTVPLTFTVADDGATVTLATGTGGAVTVSPA